MKEEGTDIGNLVSELVLSGRKIISRIIWQLPETPGD
jgi:hypothetical protein